MSEPEIRSSEDVAVPDDAPDALPPVLPPEREGAIDRFLTWIEEQPLFAGAAIFFALLVVHILVLNLAGTASGIFIDGQFFAAVGTNAIEIFVLAFIAYNFVFPTLVGAACVRTYDDLRPALMIDDRTFGQTRAGLVDAFPVWRASFGGFCAVVLTTVYGPLLQRLIPGEIGAASLPTIWLYIRLALTFGLLGSSIAYVAMLHHRFRAATGTQLRIELFDLVPVQPIARYARHVALCRVPVRRCLCQRGNPSRRFGSREWCSHRSHVGRAPFDPRSKESGDRGTPTLRARTLAPRLCRRPLEGSRQHPCAQRDAERKKRNRPRR
jgi:hypothetical protein